MPLFPAFLPETRQAKSIGADFQVQILPQAAFVPPALSTWGQLVVLGDMAVVADSFEGLCPQGADDI